MSLLELASWIVLAFWVALMLDRNRRWPAEMTLPRPAAPISAADLLVVVPARNEAAVIEGTLPSLAAQAGSFALLVLVDDRSTDGTGEAAARVASRADARGSVVVIEGIAPPPGWMGKLHALSTGVSAGVEALGGPANGRPEWLLFTDADIRHPPDSIASLLELARGGGYDLVSVMVRLRADGFWEKLLIPPFVHFFQLLYPFRSASDPSSRVAAAAGGCVLLRRSALERAGGLDAIRGELIDDVALASAVKRSGGRCWLGLDPEMLSVRAYGSLPDVTRMVARSAFHQLGYRYSAVLGTFAFLGLFFAGPPVLAASGLWAGEGTAAVAALVAWGIQSAGFLPAVRHHRVGWGFCLTLPASSLLYAYMTGISACRHLRGLGVDWRERTVDNY